MPGHQAQPIALSHRRHDQLRLGHRESVADTAQRMRISPTLRWPDLKLVLKVARWSLDGLTTGQAAAKLAGGVPPAGAAPGSEEEHRIRIDEEGRVRESECIRRGLPYSELYWPRRILTTRVDMFTG